MIYPTILWSTMSMSTRSPRNVEMTSSMIWFTKVVSTASIRTASALHCSRAPCTTTTSQNAVLASASEHYYIRNDQARPWYLPMADNWCQTWPPSKILRKKDTVGRINGSSSSHSQNTLVYALVDFPKHTAYCEYVFVSSSFQTIKGKNTGKP